SRPRRLAARKVVACVGLFGWWLGRRRGRRAMSAPGTERQPSFHALRFGRAAARYEAQAGVQARMAEARLAWGGARAAPAGIVEFGCGTGLLTRRLRTRFPDAGVTATDAAPEMLDVARAALDAWEPATPARSVVFRELDA